jgi:anti-sigma B factor antagonist
MLDYEVKTRKVGDVTVIDCGGKISIAGGDTALRNRIREVLGEGSKKILISMSGVTRIDSSGLGELVSAYTTCTNRGCDLRLCGLSDQMADVLTVTQLIIVFFAYETEEVALSAFSS